MDGKNCSRYINDLDKIVPLINDEETNIFRMENTLHYIQNAPKTGSPLRANLQYSATTTSYSMPMLQTAGASSRTLTTPAGSFL